jgi:hypothetical protein
MNVRTWTEGTFSAVALKRNRKHFSEERSEYNLQHYRNIDILNKNRIPTPKIYIPYLHQQGNFSVPLHAPMLSRYLREESINSR